MWSYLSAKVETRAFSIDIVFKDECRCRGTGDFNKPMSRHELMVVILKVLSKSVSDALAYFKNPETEETQRFIVMMDGF